MSRLEENKALVRRWFEEAFNAGDLSQLDRYFAPTYDVHNPDIPPNLEGFTGFITMLRSAFPDMRVTIEEQIAEGDRVVQRFTARGTHRGELMGVPPTGKPVSMSVIDIVRIEDGRMAEGWFVGDFLGLLQQVGAIPAPAAAG
jgi:steroid delta-isomerase-like uncharacterized protein